MDVVSGQLIAGRYRVERELGSGGMGVVLAVRRVDGGRRYALKVVRRELAPSTTLMERFKREAQILANIQHPGVVSFRDAGIMEDGSLFLVMEHVEGETLLEILRRAAPLSPRDLAPILTSVASALDAVAAAGIVHRDLKPANVLVCPDGSAKLVDFGVAHAVQLERLTLTGTSVGTPRYMAPEQLRAGGDIDARVDQYALGVIAYGALAGRPPFEKPGLQAAEDILAGRVTPLAATRPDLPPALCAAVARAMALDSSARFPSSGAFARAFGEAAQRAPVSSLAPTLPRAQVYETPTTETGITTPAFEDEIASSFGRSHSGPLRRGRTSRAAIVAALAAGALLGAVGVGALVGLGERSADVPPPPKMRAPATVNVAEPEPESDPEPEAVPVPEAMPEAEPEPERVAPSKRPLPPQDIIDPFGP